MNSQAREKIIEALGAAKQFIFGQDDMLDGILAALVCEGHLLIEGMPGLGKTMSINAVSRLCDLAFNRVQFTPDLLPSDLVGTMIYSQKAEEFSTKFGPIFTQLLLADEINRSPAKVQSALLEAMAEKQVTIGDQTHRLSSPFVVMATQNPIEQEGTYPLPEAQLDRFMMKIEVGYPDFRAERQILEKNDNAINKMASVLSTDDLIEAQGQIEEIYMDEKIKDLIVSIVHATRPGNKLFMKKYDGAILAGASPRAAIWLHKVSRFMAFMEGKDFVSPENILGIVPSVLGHRIILSYEASIDELKTKDITLDIARSLV